MPNAVNVKMSVVKANDQIGVSLNPRLPLLGPRAGILAASLAPYNGRPYTLCPNFLTENLR